MVDREVDPLYVVPSDRELERAIASVSGVATAQIHTTEDGRDRLRISLNAGADPEVVAWSVAATLRERFGIALDPTTIALRPTSDPSDQAASATASGAPPPPPRQVPTPSDGFMGDPALVAAARAVLHLHAPVNVEAATLPDVVAPRAAERDPTDRAPEGLDGQERPRPTPRRGGSRGGSEVGPEAERWSADEVADEDDGPPATEPTITTDPVDARRFAPPRSSEEGLDGAGPTARRRAAIAELVARPEGDDLAVMATLRLAGREATGAARGLSTRRGRWRAIAHATLGALGELTQGQLRADVDHVTVLTFPDLAHVTVAVSVLGDHGEERFLGAAMVRDDPDRAVMRATLDAVNRRVEPWLVGGERPA